MVSPHHEPNSPLYTNLATPLADLDPPLEQFASLAQSLRLCGHVVADSIKIQPEQKKNILNLLLWVHFAAKDLGFVQDIENTTVIGGIVEIIDVLIDPKGYFRVKGRDAHGTVHIYSWMDALDANLWKPFLTNLPIDRITHFAHVCKTASSTPGDVIQAALYLEVLHHHFYTHDSDAEHHLSLIKCKEETLKWLGWDFRNVHLSPRPGDNPPYTPSQLDNLIIRRALLSLSHYRPIRGHHNHHSIPAPPIVPNHRPPPPPAPVNTPTTAAETRPTQPANTSAEIDSGQPQPTPSSSARHTGQQTEIHAAHVRDVNINTSTSNVNIGANTPSSGSISISSSAAAGPFTAPAQPPIDLPSVSNAPEPSTPASTNASTPVAQTPSAHGTRASPTPAPAYEPSSTDSSNSNVADRTRKATSGSNPRTHKKAKITSSVS
ncbi:hypothetical protein JCM3765_001265, partial [Sporobolomyces pararoseus]